MQILLSNDDGVEALGIVALAEAAAPYGTITTVAPARERSTTSHSLTLHKPLRFWSMGERRYATSGSPADCVYLAIHEVLHQRPDLVLSGINAGANLGTDVHYSGTVAAAREAALLGLKAMAFSLVSDGEPMDAEHFQRAAVVVREVIGQLHPIPLPTRCFWNVNIPNVAPGKLRGLKICRQGIRHYKATTEQRLDPRGKPYFWIGGPYEGYEANDDSDCHAVAEGWVSATPLGVDVTDSRALASAREFWNAKSSSRAPETSLEP